MNVQSLSGPHLQRLRVSLPRMAWRLLARWCRRHRQRVDLAELDDHLLADIGRTREQVRHECARPFWR